MKSKIYENMKKEKKSIKTSIIFSKASRNVIFQLFSKQLLKLNDNPKIRNSYEKLRKIRGSS